MPKISPKTKQQALQLRYQGKSLVEIGSIVNIHPGTVKKWPHVDLNKTEWELMQELGYNRIYDCGKKTWIKWL